MHKIVGGCVLAPFQSGGAYSVPQTLQPDRGGASSFSRVNRPLIMVRARVNGSNKRAYRVKARALGLQLV